MVRHIKINKGHDIPVNGPPTQTIDKGQELKTVALLGRDYLGIKPRVLVEPGQAVGLGQSLFLDKHDPAVLFTAPGTGSVIEVNWGPRRTLQSIVIKLDENVASEQIFSNAPKHDAIAIRNLLLQSGAWTGFRTRPFDQVPRANSSAHAIFISAIDTRPLSANPNTVISSHGGQFNTGMQAIACLTDGPVFLCTGSDWSEPEPSAENIDRVVFAGPHPAGLAGTHIHHLYPVSANRSVWHINYQDVIAIGHLLETGRLFVERVVAIGGPGALQPRLLRTRLGANIDELLSGEICSDPSCLSLSGSVLDGVAAIKPINFLGRYHYQVSIIPDKVKRGHFSFFTDGLGRPSFANLFNALGKLLQLRKYPSTYNGSHAAMVPVDTFERVIPLDILPSPLFRALLVTDTATALALGCLELAEEDLALSSFACPARLDYGAALRINLNQIQKDG